MARQVLPRPQYQSPPKVETKGKRLNRRTRKGMKEDALYLAIRDVYLECNPQCVRCEGPATEIHHIVSGTAGKNVSRLNSDTWLGVCSEYHRVVDGWSFAFQREFKSCCVGMTIERLQT